MIRAAAESSHTHPDVVARTDAALVGIYAILADFHARVFGDTELSRLSGPLRSPLGFDWLYDLCAVKEARDNEPALGVASLIKLLGVR